VPRRLGAPWTTPVVISG